MTGIAFYGQKVCSIKRWQHNYKRYILIISSDLVWSIQETHSEYQGAETPFCIDFTNRNWALNGILKLKTHALFNSIACPLRVHAAKQNSRLQRASDGGITALRKCILWTLLPRRSVERILLTGGQGLATGQQVFGGWIEKACCLRVITALWSCQIP